MMNMITGYWKQHLSFLICSSSWPKWSIAVVRGCLSVCLFLPVGIWSSLPLGEQLYWSPELPLFLPLPPFPDSAHYGRVWLWPPLCPLPHGGTLRGPHGCHVSFKACGLHDWEGEEWGKLNAMRRGSRENGYSLRQGGWHHGALFSLTVWLQNGSDVCGWLILHPCSWPHGISRGAGG